MAAVADVERVVAAAPFKLVIAAAAGARMSLKFDPEMPSILVNVEVLKTGGLRGGDA